MSLPFDLARFVAPLGWALVHALWQGALVAFLLSGVLALLRNASAEARYALCVGALALAALLPVGTFVLLAYDAAPALPGRATLTPAPEEVAALTAALESAAVPTAVPAPMPWRVLALLLLRQAMPWLVLVWMAGAATMALRLAGGWAYARHLTRVGVQPVDAEWAVRLELLAERMRVSRPVRLLQSARVEVPVVIGWLRPVVLFPVGFFAGVPVEHVEAVLAHELAHVRRHDYLVSVLQGLVEAVFYYSPAVWWISRQVREAREACCDDAAVATCGDPLVYARALAELEALRQERHALALGAGGIGLRARIERVLGVAPEAPSTAPVVLATVGLALTLLVGARLVAEPEPAPPPPPPPPIYASSSANNLPFPAPPPGSFVGMLQKNGWTLNMKPNLAPHDTVAWMHVAFADRTEGTNPPVTVFQIGITEHELTRIDSLQAALVAAAERGDERAVAIELHKVRVAQQVLQHRHLDVWAASMSHALQNAYEVGNDGTREQVIQALAGGGPEAQVRIIQAARIDPSPRVRTAAVSILAASADVYAPLLRQVALEDEAAEVRRVATRGLALSGGRQARPTLQAIYEQSPHVDTRSLAIIGLGMQGAESASYLSRVLERDPAVAADVLIALGGTNSADAVEPIVRFARRTTDPALRLEALEALQSLALYDVPGAAEAIEAL